MLKEKMLDMNLYNIYWRKLQQLKFDINYYDTHFDSCVRLCRFIKYIIAGVTALATGAWMTWENSSIVKVICVTVILLLQVISAVSESFPYEQRKLELRELSTELESLYIKMESDWRKIQCMQLSNEEIQEHIESYSKKQAEIVKHYFKDDALPIKKSIRNKADVLTDEYFKNFI